MYNFTAPGYYDGTRRDDDSDDCDIGSYEREGMESIKQEILKQWAFIDESISVLQVWEDAELKLQALAGSITN